MDFDNLSRKIQTGKDIIGRLLVYLPPSCANFRPEAEEMKKAIKEAEDYIK
jgi:hypothetical protein